MKKLFLAVFLLAFVTVWTFGQTNFATAQDLFMQNKPGEAVTYLELAVAEEPSNITASLFLGIAYEQLDMPEMAIVVYRQVIDRAGNLTANIANNLGNVFFRKGSIEDAESMFTRAIQADRTFANAHLGRANIRLQRGLLNEAVSDYETYLIFAPQSPQRPSIERLIAQIRWDAGEAERQRAAAEQAEMLAAIQAERRRLAEEEEARLAAERRRRLMDDVAASLQAAAEGTQGMTVGAEGLERFEGEFELE